MAPYDVASRAWAKQIQPATLSIPISNPRFLSEVASCDMASNICRALLQGFAVHSVAKWGEEAFEAHPEGAERRRAPVPRHGGAGLLSKQDLDRR